MLSQSQRTTILELHSKGKTKREIARLLELSRQSVRKVKLLICWPLPDALFHCFTRSVKQ